MKLNQQETDLILETVMFYNSNNRGLRLLVKGDESPDHWADAQCTYFDDTTRRTCAVGRCLTDEGRATFAKIELEYKGSSVSIVHNRMWANDEDFYSHFLPQYRDVSVAVFKDLQLLHDNACSWSPEGISEHGLETVGNMFGQDIKDMAVEALKAKKHEAHN